MKSISTIFLLIVSQAIIAQTASKQVESKVTRVTVFPEGAQVTRVGQSTVTPGRSELVFGGISPYMDASSIQVEGQGGFTILSVSPQPNKLREQKKRKEIEEVEKSKERFIKQLTRDKASLSVFQKEEQMLDANQKVGGENTSMKAADLSAALELHRTRLKELKLFEIDYNDKIKKTEDTLNTIDAQIRALDNTADLSTIDLIVTVQSKENANADFTLNYVVHNAGWYPSYDLHVDDITKPLVLNYKANVSQNTGEEWKDVRLTFSNGNPNESGVAPELRPLSLYNLLTHVLTIDDIKKSEALSVENAAANAAGVTQTDAGGALSINGSRTDEVQYVVNGHRMVKNYMADKSNISYRTQTQNATTTSIELATPYTVINDGKNRAVDMKQEEIPATFEYFCVPKMEKKVYLIAHVTNWLDYNLMDGEVNLYYEGTYTGKTAFSLANVEDTLNLSLGRDKGITVNRTQIKEFSKKQLLSDKKSASATYEIAIRNNKKFPINIVIEDQLPISTDKAVTIEDATYEGAQKDETTGKLTWKVSLDPAKDKKLKLSYTVKYPKTYRVRID